MLQLTEFKRNALNITPVFAAQLPLSHMCAACAAIPEIESAHYGFDESCLMGKLIVKL